MPLLGVESSDIWVWSGTSDLAPRPRVRSRPRLRHGKPRSFICYVPSRSARRHFRNPAKRGLSRARSAARRRTNTRSCAARPRRSGGSRAGPSTSGDGDEPPRSRRRSYLNHKGRLAGTSVGAGAQTRTGSSGRVGIGPWTAVCVLAAPLSRGGVGPAAQSCVCQRSHRAQTAGTGQLRAWRCGQSTGCPIALPSGPLRSSGAEPRGDVDPRGCQRRPTRATLTCEEIAQRLMPVDPRISSAGGIPPLRDTRNGSDSSGLADRSNRPTHQWAQSSTIPRFWCGRWFQGPHAAWRRRERSG